MDEAAKYAMSTVDPEFASSVHPGDIFVAENNLGSGSSRETAPLTLKILGIRMIVAKSYARIFYRNCINLGILAIECEKSNHIKQDDQLEIDYENGTIRNLTERENYTCDKVPPHIMELVAKGGLVESLKAKI